MYEKSEKVCDCERVRKKNEIVQSPIALQDSTFTPFFRRLRRLIEFSGWRYLNDFTSEFIESQIRFVQPSHPQDTNNTIR